LLLILGANVLEEDAEQPDRKETGADVIDKPGEPAPFWP
jgi:hypothetical protein